jgi:hypothetical protein
MLVLALEPSALVNTTVLENVSLNTLWLPLMVMDTAMMERGELPWLVLNLIKMEVTVVDLVVEALEEEEALVVKPYVLLAP